VPPAAALPPLPQRLPPSPAAAAPAAAAAAGAPAAAAAKISREGKHGNDKFGKALGAMLDADEAGRLRPSLAKACLAAGIVNAQGKAVARESLRGYIKLMDACAPAGGWALTLGKVELAAAKLARRFVASRVASRVWAP